MQVLRIKDPRNNEIKHICNRIEVFFDEVIYIPLKDFLADETTLDNSGSAIANALNARTLEYSGEYFTGKFSSKISKELTEIGAKLQADGKSWKIKESSLPIELMGVCALAKQHAHEKHLGALRLLRKMQANMVKADPAVYDDSTTDILIGAVAASFKEEAGKPVTFSGAKLLKEQYRESLTKMVMESAEKRIEALKAIIKANDKDGSSLKKLDKLVEVDETRARSAARAISQRVITSVVARIVEESSKVLGSTKYVWVTSLDERVRPGHAILHNKVFSWGDPPITDPITGTRCHPGEDNNCRCWALPIINMKDEASENTDNL